MRAHATLLLALLCACGVAPPVTPPATPPTRADAGTQDPDPPLRAIETIAEEGARTYRLSVDATHVYWGVDGSPGRLVRWSKAGRQEEVVAETPRLLEGIALDDLRVYWVLPYSTPSLWARGLVGGSPVPLDVSEPIQPTGVHAYGDHLYFGGTGVRRVPKAGGQVELLNKDPVQATFVAVDADGVHACAGGRLFTVPHAGGEARLLAVLPVGQCMGVVSDATGVVALVSDERSPGCDSQLIRVAKSGGFPQSFGARPVCGRGVVTDGQSLYWVGFSLPGGSDTTLFRAPLTGGASVPLASPTGYTWSLGVDDTHVYWTDGDAGRVRRVAK